MFSKKIQSNPDIGTSAKFSNFILISGNVPLTDVHLFGVDCIGTILFSYIFNEGETLDSEKVFCCI